MRRGWRNDSFRHSLAARGIRSYRKSKFLESLKVQPTEGEASQNAVLAARVRSQCEEKLFDAIEDGVISAEDARMFWPSFDQHANRFMEGSRTYTYQDFKADTVDKCDDFIDRHSGKMSISGMINGRNTS